MLNYKRLGFQPARLDAITLSSWNAGLWYSRPYYKMQGNMVVEACDVDITRDGCICTRKPVQPVAYGPTSRLCSLWSYERADGTAFVMAQDVDGKVWMTTPPSTNFIPAPIPDAITTGGCCYSHWIAHGKLFLSDGSKVIMWDGVNAYQDVTNAGYHDTEVDPAASDDVTDLGVPASCFGATFNNAVWLGAPNVSSGEHSDEVWWSAFLGDYSGVQRGERDFSDARALGFPTTALADSVQAIAPCGGKLWVMKRHSIHYIAPSDFQLTSFAQKTVAEDIGIANPKAWACTQGVLFMYDAKKGLYGVSDSGAAFLMDQIWEGPNGICVKNTNPALTAVGVCGQRVLVSIAESASDRNTHTYVFDIRSRNWTRWCIGFDCFGSFAPTRGKCFGCLGVVSSPCFAVVAIDEKDESDCLIDDFGCAKKNYYPSVQTAWFDAGSPYVEKRWLNTELTFEVGKKDTSVGVASTVDWDLTPVNRESIELLSGDTDCIVPNDDGCIVGAMEVCEVVSPGDVRNLPAECPPGQQLVRPADSAIVQTQGAAICSSRSTGMTIETTGEGRWCLYRYIIFLKTKKVRA